MASTHMVRIGAVMSCMSVSLAGAQQGHTAAQLRLGRADSLFLANSFQMAANEYHAFLQTDSANHVAWLRMGLSLERAGKRDDAIAAYTRAATSAAQRTAAEMGLTRIFAQQPGKTQIALEHLKRLALLGVDPALLDQAPALATLRGTPEFADIRKLAEEARFPCRNVHTFDFWAGDFDASQWRDQSGKSGGQLHNTRDYDGCVFVERWSPLPGRGPAGMSFAFYDAIRHVWRFIWNDDGNGSVEFEGDYRDGAMRFEARVTNPDGTTFLARNVLQSVSPDTIRHTFSMSEDEGKTWTVQADDRFARRRP